MKPIDWLGSSKRDISAFPDEARREAGNQLFLVQLGLEPIDWKPMPSVGTGVNEIRVHAGGQWRVLCVAKFADAVYLLHAFGKKTQRTAKADIEIATTRYRDLVNAIKAKK
jgi:phage-related protein